MEKSLFLMHASESEISLAKELHLTSVFTGFQNISKISELRSSLPGVKIYVELQAFSKDSYLKHITNSDVVCLDSSADVSNYLCPTSPTVINTLLENVKKCVDEKVDGIWLDSFKYATKWAKSEPDLLDTCYCPRCLAKFEEYIGEKIEGSTLEEKFLHIDGSYYIEWLEFKTKNLSDVLSQVQESLNETKILLGVFIVPWEEADHGSGLKRLLGVNLSDFSDKVDIISPMLYHKMCGKDVGWIKSRIEYYRGLGLEILPLVQTEDKPDNLSHQEFKDALHSAAAAGSLGVCVFFAEDVIKNRDKVQVLKDF